MISYDHTGDRSPRSVARDTQALPAIDRALADLAEVETLVPLLALLRDPAAKRPWREVQLDAWARAELDDEARAELAERTEDAPGEHRDAARADVLDVLSGVLWRAEDLAHHLSRAARCPILPPARADGDPRPYLAHAAACLPTAVTGWENGKEIAQYAADTAAAMVADLESALALNVDGHTVKAVCPWCRGGLAGSYTWRVRVVADEPAIVCESGLCQPSSREVTTWWKGCPVWRFPDWPWLAKRVAHLDARRMAEAAPPPRALPAAPPAPPISQAEVELLAGLAPEPPTDEGTAA
ncbi:hypothetical protein E1287_37745 [Actinomadura sp. KC06]|uniref:hypothetical protein n=1 Tax=Actinomadura sp. KC06 TaxID=2530369 RepID=UPI001049FC56|nr:hypothetical protein [Actinomadura sp. KC06]TDD25007.1 hypothetical protein E1287_37745 [Actinomadura sp. KC06]